MIVVSAALQGFLAAHRNDITDHFSWSSAFGGVVSLRMTSLQKSQITFGSFLSGIFAKLDLINPHPVNPLPSRQTALGPGVGFLALTFFLDLGVEGSGGYLEGACQQDSKVEFIGPRL